MKVMNKENKAFCTFGYQGKQSRKRPLDVSRKNPLRKSKEPQKDVQEKLKERKNKHFFLTEKLQLK